MNVVNKYKVISDWLTSYPKLYDWLYFNATQMINDNTSLNSVSGERKINEFIDGSYIAELYFSISMVKGYDSETSLTNIDSIFEIENFMDWIDNDDNLTNLNFGASVNLLEIDVMQNVPTILVDKEQNLAKYQFQARIKYIQN